MRAAFDALGAWGAAAGMAEVTSNADESHVPEPYCFRAVFISDLHLQPSEPQTVEAWRSYLARSTADAIFILGDLFEVWVGDDALDEPGSFEAECAAVLREAAQRIHALPGAGDEEKRYVLRVTCLREHENAVRQLLLAGPRWLQVAHC